MLNSFFFSSFPSFPSSSDCPYFLSFLCFLFRFIFSTNLQTNKQFTNPRSCFNKPNTNTTLRIPIKRRRTLIRPQRMQLLGLLFLVVPLFCWERILAQTYPLLPFSIRLHLSICIGPVVSSWLLLFTTTWFRSALQETLHPPFIWLTLILQVLFLFSLVLAKSGAFTWDLSSGNPAPSDQTSRPESTGLLPRPLPVFDWDEHGDWLYKAMLPLGLLLVWTSLSHTLLPDAHGNLHGNPMLGYHLAMIHSFLFGKNSQTFSLFTMANPTLEGDRLLEPFILDYYVAVLISAGISLRAALLITACMNHSAFLVMFYQAASKFTQSDYRLGDRIQFVPIVALYLAFFMGGSFWGTEPSYWLSFLKGVYFDSRHAPVGYALSLGILFVFWTGLDLFYHQKPNLARQYIQLAGFLTALLPYVHPHSFLAIVFVASMNLVLERFDSKDLLSINFIHDAFQYGGPLLLLALPQLASFIDGESEWGILKLHRAWKHHYGGILGWLWGGLGLYFILAILSFCVLNRVQKVRLGSAYFLFLIASVMKFQPDNISNIKLFYVWVFISSFAVAVLLKRFYESSLKMKLVVIAFMCLHIAPGVMNAIDFMNTDITLYDSEDIRVADWARNHTSANAVFLIGSPPPRDVNPIMTLAGKNVILGTIPWAKSRGIDPAKQIRWTRKVLSGDKDALYICKSFGIDFIEVAGWASGQDTEIFNIQPNIPWLEKYMKKVYETPRHVIFEVRDKRKRIPKKVYGPLYYFHPPPKK